MHNLSLRELAAGLRARQFSSRELTQHFLARIARLDPALNSFVTVCADAALTEADLADARLAAGEAGPLTYRSYVVAGLDASKFTAAGIRGGRQKGARSKAEDFAWTGRVDYTAMPGLLAGVSAYFGGSGQGLKNAAGEEVGEVRTTLVEGHLEWKWRGLELRALAVRGTIDDVAALNRALGLTGNRSVGERQDGWYVQAGFDLFARRAGGRAALVPYARFEELDTQAEVPAGWLRNPANEQEILTLGLAWKPIPQLILKGDWQDVDNAAGSGVDQWNVALGYIF